MGTTQSNSRLDRIAAMKKEAREVLQKINYEGYTLMRGQSSFARKETYFIHKGPIGSGDDLAVTPSQFRNLMAADIFEDGPPLLNGWVKTYRLKA